MHACVRLVSGLPWTTTGPRTGDGKRSGRSRVMTGAPRTNCARPYDIYPRIYHTAPSSLGFAGTILVRSEEDLEYVKASGPMNVLAVVGVPW